MSMQELRNQIDTHRRTGPREPSTKQKQEKERQRQADKPKRNAFHSFMVLLLDEGWHLPCQRPPLFEFVVTSALSSFVGVYPLV